MYPEAHAFGIERSGGALTPQEFGQGEQVQFTIEPLEQRIDVGIQGNESGGLIFVVGNTGDIGVEYWFGRFHHGAYEVGRNGIKVLVYIERSIVDFRKILGKGIDVLVAEGLDP